jgi:hypothetical protein
MAIAACGKSLRMIDNEAVRRPELELALSLGKVRDIDMVMHAVS